MHLQTLILMAQKGDIEWKQEDGEISNKKKGYAEN